MKVFEKNGIPNNSFKDIADEHKIAYNWACIEEKRRKKPLFQARMLLVTAATVFICVTVFILLRIDSKTGNDETLFLELSESTPSIAVPSYSSHEKQVALSDGSILTLAPGALLEVKESSPSKIELSLLKGWVRFRVTPNKKRIWAVEGGFGRAVVLGTQFTMSRSPHSLKVAVHSGTVAVYEANTDNRLTKLTSGQFYEFLENKKYENIVTDAQDTKQIESEDSLSTDADTLLDNAIEKNRRSLQSVPKSPMPSLSEIKTSDSVNALLKAADDARNRNNNREAANLLAQILTDYPNDSAAGVAALTLGRIRMDSLNQPKEAAAAFEFAAKSKKMPSPLKEQAYARCVEALSKANLKAEATVMKERYKTRYPNGAWLKWVEHWVSTE